MSCTVVITGCSSGFGLLAAVAAAGAGCQVVATMRNLDKRQALDAAAAEAKVQLDVLQLDVDDQASIDRCVAEILSRRGRIDVLVNNAGFGMGGTIYDLTMAELRAQMETNFFGAVAMTKAVLPGMVANNSGKIINVTSIAAIHSTPGMGAYNASKRALEGLSEALRYELAGKGISVCTVLPGMYKTEVFAKRKEAAQGHDATSPFSQSSQHFSRKVDRLVEKKGQDPQEVCRLLVRLIQDPDPPLQSIVGRDAKLQSLLRSVVTERVWERMVRKFSGF